MAEGLILFLSFLNRFNVIVCVLNRRNRFAVPAGGGAKVRIRISLVGKSIAGITRPHYKVYLLLRARVRLRADSLDM